MDILKIIFLLLFSISCTTPHYLFKQSMGQLKLQRSGVKNERVLDDATVSQEHKEKIQLVIKAKNFFLEYFNHRDSGIYSKTIFLDTPEITWLVIASRPDEIKAYEHNFLFMGSFPYLGFFSKDDALAFEKRLIQKGLVTWMRPVYAYSTLGYFEDRILSSFFEYDEVELVELIFHELFHTLFFVKDYVELNENLASFFADKLLEEFFKNDPKLLKYRADQVARREYEAQLAVFAQNLEEEYARLRPQLEASRAREILELKVKEELFPIIKKYCLSIELAERECPTELSKWNQARLASVLTYQSSQNFLSELQKTMSLRDYLIQLQSWYAQWRKQSDIKDFMEYLKSNL
jgi:predicted aminopeptidase